MKSEYIGISGAITSGSPGLDARPPELQRSTIFAWVRRCPGCGCCARDLDQACPGADAVVKGEEYRNQFNNPDCPESANSFLCAAIVYRQAGNYAAAARDLINAAWVCDDSGHFTLAVECRLKAADTLLLAEERGQQAFDAEELNFVVLVDLLRRSGWSEQARQVIAEHRGKFAGTNMERILDFQAYLLDKNDVLCHNIAEIYRGRERKDGNSNTIGKIQ